MHSVSLRRRVGQLVRVHRKDIESSYLDAYLLDASESLVLLQVVTERIDFDGYDVVRCEDISRAVRSPRAAYVEKALALKRLRPKKPKRIALESTAALLESVNAAHPLFVIHRERKAPDVCEVGQLVDVGPRSYRIRWISPDAVLETKPRRYDLGDVTRVQFDNGYEKTLAMVAAAEARR